MNDALVKRFNAHDGNTEGTEGGRLELMGKEIPLSGKFVIIEA